MPTDIRNFFGGKPSVNAPKQEKVLGTKDSSRAGNKRRNNVRVILDDSDDEVPLKSEKLTPEKDLPKKMKESPLGEETTATDYFASSSKGKANKPTSTKNNANPGASSSVTSQKKVSDQSRKGITSNVEVNNRRFSQRKWSKKSYSEYNDSSKGDKFLDDNPDTGDDILVVDVKNDGGHRDDGYLESESKEDLSKKVKKVASRANLALRKDEHVDMKGGDDLFTVSDNNEKPTTRAAKARGASPSSKKRKSVDLEDDEDSEDVDAPKKGPKTKIGAQRPPAKKPRAKKEGVLENAEIQAIFDSIPIVKAPSPPSRDIDKKFDWRGGGPGNSRPPPAAGAKEIPIGAENCLAGLTFVFTGLLETISRDAAQELVKRYGGRVTGAPSSKTSYVILGSDAGPAKLEKIKAMNIKTVSEDGLFELIRRLPASGGGGRAAEKTLEKKKTEERRVKREAVEMEKEEKRLADEAQKAAKKAAAARGLTPVTAATGKPLSTSQLWTTKYAPTKTNQICGNKAPVEKIQRWLQKWPYNRKYNFTLPGADGSGKYRAIIIHGPPGIGKTTAAHLAAKLEGYDIIESNASDTRSKKLVESGLGEVLNNNSLLGFFAGDGKEVSTQKKKIVLIMDEVDGMSAGDRGGVGALAKVCKQTEVPLILICNERKIPKMKPFDHVAYDIQFRRPTVEQVRSRIATICVREGLKIPPPVIDALIEGSNKDIRRIINMLSTAKLDRTSMDFDQGKSMSKAWEKHIILTPWDICQKLLGGGMFAPTSNATLNDKIELYFNDHELSYLIIQENYLNTVPMLATNQGLSTKEQNLRTLELAEKAAESISDGDLVDCMIHGSQQQWSLMPTHAVFSSVRPASFVSGLITGNIAFTKWLGNNSKQGKLSRYIKEIQAHMRLRTSGDRHDVRQQYLPVLWDRLVKRLEIEGKECIEEVIRLMDSYFLTKDDFDYIIELGLGPQEDSGVKIETATKSHFTRLYNSRSHPLPFMKASGVITAQKGPRIAPDLEEAIEEEDDVEVLDEDQGDDENGDILKDKYIKKPRAQKDDAVKKPAAKKGRKTTKDVEDAEDDSEDEPKPNVRVRKTRGPLHEERPKIS